MWGGKKKERMTGIDDTVNCKVNGQLILKSEKLLYVNNNKRNHINHIRTVRAFKLEIKNMITCYNETFNV